MITNASLKFGIVAHAKTSLTQNHLNILRSCNQIVAADGGADHLFSTELKPHLIIGDLDGISPKALTAFQSIEILRFARDKDETDLELAIKEALKRGATELHIFCWADDRIDFSYGILFSLRTIAIPTTLYIGEGTVVILNNTHPTLEIPHPSKISIYSLDANTELKSHGLKWELEWKANFQSTSQSNETLKKTTLKLSQGSVFCVVLPLKEA
jgi:thiamine pyrophosphokinase